MKKLTIHTLLICLAFMWTGCQEDPEPGGTATQDVAGEWWVREFADDGTGTLEAQSGYVKIMTFNTASNTADSLWLYDLDNIWEIQVKVPYDANAKTFSVSEGQNVTYDSRVTIEDGKVLLGQGLSTSGVKTDSIYFVVSYSDDTPSYGTKYVWAGHRRTGFLEDEQE